MKSVLSAMTALCVVATTAGLAQTQQPAGYHSVNCVKVLEGKLAEYRDYMKESRKVAQVLADSGAMATAYRLRTVMPAGAAATCDYVLVNVYKGAPPAPRPPEALNGLLKQAGVSMTAAEYIGRRSAVSRLVSTEMWRTAMSVGDMKKGDYLFVNHMKVHNMDNWMELERSVWKPMAETWVKDGALRGWMVARPVLPGGTDLKYQAVTLDVMPSWDAIYNGPPVEKTFKQVHADKDLNQVFEKLGKTRDLAVRELLVVEDVIVPGTGAR